MIINVFSYNKAESSIKENERFRKNWISIRDLGYSKLYNVLDEMCENVLELYFDDVTEYSIKHNMLHPFYIKEYMRRGLVCFNEEHAIQIIDFANEIYERNEELNIHCWAGKSRSQAVGYVLNTYYNLYLNKNKKDFFRNINHNFDNFMGNYDVMRIMNKVLYGENE